MTSSLYRTETRTTIHTVTVPLNFKEIREMAKNSKQCRTCSNSADSYGEIRDMTQNADCKNVKAIVQGALDDNNELKVIAIIRTLLNKIENGKTLNERSKTADILKIAFETIPQEKMCWITEIDTSMNSSLQLYRLNERKLDELLRLKNDLNLSEEVVTGLKTLIAHRNNLNLLRLPPFMWD